MDFYMKLPRNRKEFALFLGIVSILSVNIIAPLISCFEMGFSFQTWQRTFLVMPFIWLTVVILVLLTHGPAGKITSKIIDQKDSFASHMIVSCLVNVAMMCAVLTIVATWIGTHTFSLDPIASFFYKAPRNFSISLFVELLIAQPFARWILYKKHLNDEQKQHKF